MRYWTIERQRIIQPQLQTIYSNGKPCYIATQAGIFAATNPPYTATKTLHLVKRYTDSSSVYYIDEEKNTYYSLPSDATEHGTPSYEWVDTNTYYEWAGVQTNTQWTPPKEGYVRAVVYAGQNYKNYSDNINGERVERILSVSPNVPVTVTVGKSGDWDRDNVRYYPGISQFDTIVAHVGNQYPALKNRPNGLYGYVKVTYVEKRELSDYEQ